jgi:hypothetical protein
MYPKKISGGSIIIDQTRRMQHVDDFGDESKSVGRNVEPEIEGLNELRAHVLPWGGSEEGEGF